MARVLLIDRFCNYNRIRVLSPFLSFQGFWNSLIKDLYKIEDSYFLLEYPHTELFSVRLDTYFKYSAIKTPQKVYNYLINLQKEYFPERFFKALGRAFPFLRKFSPDFGVVFNI
jgi:hypothetical protein